MVDTMADKNTAQFDVRELFAELADIKDVTLGFERWHVKRKNCRRWRLGAESSSFDHAVQYRTR